jgi:hypothetical protein
MIIYEITAKVRLDLCEKYETYMRETHIQDLLDTGAFSGASLAKGDAGIYRIQYEAYGREELDRYLKEHAPSMREDVDKHFPEGVETSRAEWTVIEKW